MKRIYYILTLSIFIIISIYHEPWFDEAQAWQIAKCSSIYDIIFTIPHYEGHPPLWHLLLALPAKLCLTFEIGLKSYGLLFYATSTYLILYKSAFPKLAKVLLPLSYFAFYQYGIVTRPYGLMILTSLLLGMNFEKRNEQPFIFIGLLILLCLESAYGMLFAAAIAIIFSYEIMSEKGFITFFKEIFIDKRTQYLLGLLVTGIIVTIEILPYNDTLITSSLRYNSFIKCFITSFFTFIGECTLTGASWFHNESVLFQQVPIPFNELIIFIIIGCLLWVIIIAISPIKKLKYFILPFLFFSIFSSAVYMNTHHVGFVVIIGLFWMWLVFEDTNRCEIGHIALHRISASKRDRELAKKAVKIIGVLCLIVPCYWTVSACIIDVSSEYSYGRGTAHYLEMNDLINYKIFSAPGNEASTVYSDPTLLVSTPTEVTAYFDRNIVYNFNSGDDKQAFFWHRIYSKEQINRTIEEWKNIGLPDVILGYMDLSYIYGDSFTYDDYSLVYVNDSKLVWKDSYSTGILPVYVNNDLIRKLNLNVLPDYSYIEDGSFSITDEMKNQYEHGVAIEEILKPYLDEIL